MTADPDRDEAVYRGIPSPSPRSFGFSAPHYEATDRTDPLDPGELRRNPPDVAGALRAYRDLVRVARDISAEPALPHILAVLRDAAPSLRDAMIAARREWISASEHRGRLAGLPTDTPGAIGELERADRRLDVAAASKDRSERECVEVARVLAIHGGHRS
jgi:hypothetical protein